MKPLARLAYGTGNPASCPDFRPLNPWGRPMPKPERPYRDGRIYQVCVKDRRDSRVKPVGPRWQGKEFAEMFMLTIQNQISLGTERRWSEPHLVMFV